MQLPDFNNSAQISQNWFTSTWDPSPSWASGKGPEATRAMLPSQQTQTGCDHAATQCTLRQKQYPAGLEYVPSWTGVWTMQKKMNIYHDEGNTCNHDSGFCSGLLGPLRKAGRLPKDLFKDRTSSTNAIIGDIRIPKLRGFLWFIGWGVLVFLVLPALLYQWKVWPFSALQRLQEEWSSYISNFKTGMQQKKKRKQSARTHESKTQGQDQNFSLCPWVLCVPWSLWSLQLSHWRTLKALCIFCYMKERFSVQLSVRARAIPYIRLILANKQRWKMAVARVCLRANIAKKKWKGNHCRSESCSKRNLPTCLLFCNAAHFVQVYQPSCSVVTIEDWQYTLHLFVFSRAHSDSHFQNSLKMSLPTEETTMDRLPTAES